MEPNRNFADQQIHRFDLNFSYKLGQGSNRGRDILRLKFIWVRNYASRSFGAPLRHGNEAGQEQLFNAWASFALSFLYPFVLL